MHTPPHPADATAAVSPAEKAQAAAASQRPLTIDTRDMRELFLPAVARKQRAVEILDKMAMAACNDQRDDDHRALCTAITATSWSLYESVLHVVHLGGLLHIGAPKALA